MSVRPDQRTRQAVELAFAQADADSSLSFLAFLWHVVIPRRPQPSRFRDVAFDWQWGFAREFAPVLHSAAFGTPKPRVDCFWQTLARGHDKTSGLARACNWLLSYASRPITIVVCAADLDQAALLTSAMKAEAELNPWLHARLTFTKKTVQGHQGAELQLVTSDAPSASGGRPDILVLDEITMWRNRDLWDIQVSSIDKLGAPAFVLTNAGTEGSWQWDVKETAKKLSRWRVYEAPGRLRTWMSEEAIAESRKLLLPAEARRVFDNVWLKPGEESGFVTRAEAEACVRANLGYRTKAEPGVSVYWAGLDYGAKRDRTALALLHQDGDGTIFLDCLDVFQGSPESPVPVAVVREWVAEKKRAFPGLKVSADPHGLEELLQDLRRDSIVETTESRASPKSNFHLATTLRNMLLAKQLLLYPSAGRLQKPDGTIEDLVDELCALVVRQVAGYWRLDHTAKMHDDRAVAIGLALVGLLDEPRSVPFKAPPKLDIAKKEYLNLHTRPGRGGVFT